MVVKILHWLGMLACVALIISCFLPWVHFADPHIANEADRTFTGFFSFQNEYGKPGKFLTFFAALALTFMVLPRVWAKRFNLFLCAFTLAYAVKTYVLFASCYYNYCPQKLFGLYLMLLCAAIMLIAACFPDMKLKKLS